MHSLGRAKLRSLTKGVEKSEQGHPKRLFLTKRFRKMALRMHGGVGVAGARRRGGVAYGVAGTRRRGHAEVWASRTQLPFAA